MWRLTPTSRQVLSSAGVAVAAAVVWVVAGAPWWAPAVLLLGGLTGRIVALLLSARWRGWSVLFGVGIAAAWLVAQLSAAGIVVCVGVAVLIGLLACPPAEHSGGDVRRSDGRREPSLVRRARPRQATASVAGLLVIAGLVGVGAEQLSDAQDRERADLAAGDFARAQLLPRSPSQAVRALLVAIAEDDPRVVCSAFSPSAATQLAAAHGGVDCAGAVHVLHSDVLDRRRYVEPVRGSTIELRSPDGESGTADGCSLRWPETVDVGTPLDRLPDPPGTGDNETRPGPQPGRLALERQLGQGFLVTAYRPCG